jgi:cupin 2 domain-containing protein
MTRLANLFDRILPSAAEESIEVLLAKPQLRIERIVSHGHSSPDDFWYDQDQNEWVLLVAGAARLEFENELVEMSPGSFLSIPAHRRHRVQWTDPNQPTVWLAIYY